jgi:hypothetical protein
MFDILFRDGDGEACELKAAHRGLTRRTVQAAFSKADWRCLRPCYSIAFRSMSPSTSTKSQTVAITTSSTIHRLDGPPPRLESCAVT